jgi:hypothetical protein
MPIRDDMEALISLLQKHPILKSADKVSQMELASGAHAGKYAWFNRNHRSCE